MSHYSEIIPHLFIGDKDALYDAHLFELIVNCTKHLRIVNDKSTIRIAVNDSRDEGPALETIVNETNVLEIIHRAIKRDEDVLVHCHAGMQRSCTIVAMYLMTYYGTNSTTAIKYIQSKRPVAFLPHPTFERVLDSWGSI
jgi:protein-tyrosine phosphatase